MVCSACLAQRLRRSITHIYLGWSELFRATGATTSDSLLLGGANLERPAGPSDYPFAGNSYFNISWTGDVTLALWATATASVEDQIRPVYSNTTQVNYTPAFPLAPFKEYHISLTVVSYKKGSLMWLYFQPGMGISIA